MKPLSEYVSGVSARLRGWSSLDLYREFGWVDEYIANVRPYLFVRLEDSLLIKRPNNAVKLNETGARILHFLLQGGSIRAVLDSIKEDAQKLSELQSFLHAVKSQSDGGIDPDWQVPGVEVVPFEMKFSEYPVLSEIALTYRCNLRCEFCYAGCNYQAHPVAEGEELTAEEVRRVLDSLFNEAKVPSVSFTGGEPTLVSELCDHIRYAKDLSMRVNLISNGTRIDAAFANRLAESGLDSAQISLEGVTAETHNAVVHARVFDKAVAAVKFLKMKGVHTHTNTTINKLNLKEILSFPVFVQEELGCDRFSMNLMIPTGSGSRDEALCVTYSEVGDLLLKLDEESRARGVEFMWYSPVPMCMFNSITAGLGNKGCSACDGLISVAPNGDVLPCASYDEAVGNLLKDGFRSVWDSRSACFFRDKEFAHSHCKTCEHFVVCNGACPLYWRERGYDELEDIIGGGDASL